MNAPDCRCHGVPMYPNKHSNGGWRCRVKVRVRQNARHHEHDWLVRRKRDLAAQRANILSRIAELEQEAVTSC